MTPGKITNFFSKSGEAQSAMKRSFPKNLSEKEEPQEGSFKKVSCDVNNDGIENVKRKSFSPEEKNQMDENRKSALNKLEIKNRELRDVGESWFEAMSNEFFAEYFTKLCQFIARERESTTIFPPWRDVFSWTLYCTIQDVKVVILGQDPYHGAGQAHGLAFSVQKGVAKPPSLLNIFKELGSDIKGFAAPDHGYLGGWAEQGVLLLNAVLTVREGKANSHKDHGWESFTDAVIRFLTNDREGIVFMLWGSYAQKKGAFINMKKHFILKNAHPSPLSAHRGFHGCRHFSLCNAYLKERGKAPIDWSHLP